MQTDYLFSPNCLLVYSTICGLCGVFREVITHGAPQGEPDTQQMVSLAVTHTHTATLAEG